MSSSRSEAEVRAVLGDLIADTDGFEDWPVERIAFSDFKPATYNPRTISDTGLIRLARSLKANGRLDTIVVNKRTGNLVSGHQRFTVLSAAGLTETWATVVDVPEYREKAMNLAANNREAQGEFEMEELATLLSELQEIDAPDFSIEDTAFDLGEVMDIVSEHGEEEEGSTDPDVVPDPPENPVSKTGDLWRLGDHSVLCGDSTRAEDVKRLMGGERHGVAVIDPPFELAESKWAGHISDPCIVFGQAKHLRAIPGYLWRFERVVDKVLAHRSATINVGHRHAFVAQCGSIRKLPSGCNTFPSIVVCEERPDHPHQKQVELLIEHLTEWTPEWTICFDPFLGSGTTLIACEKLGRRCYGIEITPQYVDVILKRWEATTEREATLDGDGRTFAEIAAERSSD